MCLNLFVGRLSRIKRQQLLGPLADSKMRLFLCTPRYFVAFDFATYNSLLFPRLCSYAGFYVIHLFMSRWKQFIENVCSRFFLMYWFLVNM
jgi:hypothetical protein